MINENKDTHPAVPYIVYESAQARAERHIRRQSIAIIAISALAIMALFLTAFLIDKGWRDYLSEFEFESTETVYQQDGKGTNIIGDSNNVAESND